MGGPPRRQCCHLAVSPQIDYPEIADGIMPRHRFMSAYEQRIEPPDRRWQYLLMAAEPYETIAFKVACTAHPSSALPNRALSLGWERAS